MKATIISAPVLIMPDFQTPFEIECDASGSGVGVVLVQQGQPIAYFSKALYPKIVSHSAYEEFMALALAINHWRPYLLGRKFVVKTDQKSLGHLLEQQIVTLTQQCWITKLLGYKFIVEYKLGCINRAADALSRREDKDMSLSALSHFPWIEIDEIDSAVRANPSLVPIVAALETNTQTHHPFTLI